MPRWVSCLMGAPGSYGPECVLRCCLRFLPIAFSTKATFICPNGPSSPPSSPAALIPATAPPFHIATALLYCCHYVASVIAPIEPNYTNLCDNHCALPSAHGVDFPGPCALPGPAWDLQVRCGRGRNWPWFTVTPSSLSRGFKRIWWTRRPA